MSRKVYQVSSVHVSISKVQPPRLHVSVAGQVSTGGWKGPELVPRIYVRPPSDGIQEFDFLATPPAGMAIQVILPISASVDIEQVEWIKGVRVYSATNSVETSITDESRLTALGPVRPE
ncbi:MAG: hypothetical protein JWQ01_2609 [Massilia sp.]|nr:hypothetical protein [Massilia sp.]